QTGKNALGAGGGGLVFYFTDKVDILTGPVYYFDPGSQPGGKQWFWTVQLDIDLPLRSTPATAPAAPVSETPAPAATTASKYAPGVTPSLAPISSTYRTGARTSLSRSAPGGNHEASTRSGRVRRIAASASRRSTDAPRRTPGTLMPRNSRRSRAVIRARGSVHAPESLAMTSSPGAACLSAAERKPSPPATSSTRFAPQAWIRDASAPMSSRVGSR